MQLCFCRITETYLQYILVKEEQFFKSPRGEELFYKLKLKTKLQVINCTVVPKDWKFWKNI